MEVTTAQKFFNNGLAFILNGDTVEGEKAFQNAIKKNTEPLVATEYFSFYLYNYLLQSNYRTLAREFSRDEKITSAGYYALYWYAFMQGDLHEIEPILRKLLHGANLFLRYFAITELYKKGAIDSIKNAVRDKIKGRELTVKLPVNQERARIYEDVLFERYHLSLLQIKKLMKKFPNFSELAYDLIEVSALIGNRETIKEVLEDEAVKRFAGWDYRVMYAMSRELFHVGEHMKARDYLEILKSVFPGNPIFCYNLGNVYAALQQENRALDHYREAINIAPDFERAYYNLGTLHLQMGNYGSAAKALDRALQLKRDTRTMYNLSVCLVESNRLEEAYHYLQDLKNSDNEYRSQALRIRDHIKHAVLTV